jgi:hypothetical protein
VTTSAITATLSNGTTATIAPLTINVQASCTSTGSLTATTSPLQVSLSDGTQLSLSSTTITATSPRTTTVGTLLCDIEAVICQLAKDLSSGATTDAVSVLNQILTQVTGAVG